MNYTAASAADDNVFYDSRREGSKIAHDSTFRTSRFSHVTFQRAQGRVVEQVLLFGYFWVKLSSG